MSIKRIVSTVLAVAIMLMIAISPISTLVTHADEVDDLKNKYSDLEKQQKEMQNKLADAKKTTAEKEEAVAIMKQQVATAYKQLDNLKSQTKSIQSEIENLNVSIDNVEKEIKENYEIFKKRLRAMYISGDTSGLSLLFSSDNLKDLLVNTELVNSLAKKDRELFDKLTADMKKLEDEKTLLNQRLEDSKQAEADMKAKYSEIDSKYKEMDNTLAELRENKDYLAAQNKKLDSEMEKLESDIKKALADKQNNNVVQSGELAWPVPSKHVITSPYGMRWGRLHKGIDISGANAYGAEIVAAKDGIVSLVVDYGSVSYGKCVMIDHGVDDKGNRISTLYGHCSAILVSQGQYVKRGQTIAKVGSTGDSTGPHLHFEYRINGNPVDPYPYLK